MMELGIHPSEKKVCFGQLLGMCDQITFPLGECCSTSTWEQQDVAEVSCPIVTPRSS